MEEFWDNLKKKVREKSLVAINIFPKTYGRNFDKKNFEKI